MVKFRWIDIKKSLQKYKQLQIKACLGLANTGKEQRYLEDALRLAMEIRDKELEIKARIGLGSFTFSLEHCNAAIHLATEIGDSLLQIKAIKIKAIALKQHGKYYESINCLKDISIVTRIFLRILFYFYFSKLLYDTRHLQLMAKQMLPQQKPFVL